MDASITATPEQGQLVQVRSRPWVVNQIKASTLPIPAMLLPIAKPQHLVTLSSVEDDWLGKIQPESWMLGKGRQSLHS